MTLQTKQIKLYSVDTNDLFIGKEKKCQDSIDKLDKLKLDIEKLKKELKKDSVNKELLNELKKAEIELKAMISNMKCNSTEEFEELQRNKIKEYIPKNSKKTRVLRDTSLTPKKLISLFESSFTRAVGVETNEVTKDVFIITIFHNEILKQILANGFNYNNKKYVFAFSSAGQIRNKKVVFIEQSLYKEISPKLYAGLTDDTINKYKSTYKNDDGKDEDVKGMVLGKLIAYKALCSSASIPWSQYKMNSFENNKKLSEDEKIEMSKFDIDNVIVVPDAEFEIKNIDLEHIDKSYKLTKIKNGSITNPYMDGAGICLPTWSDKNIQVRAPFIKGLIVPFDILAFAKKEYDIDNPKVTDIWGEEWDLKKDDIKVILTASQFKMWKFYKSWDEYKDKFKNYESEFAVCKIESNNAKDFREVKLNYQMLQTLYFMDKDELAEIVSYSKDKIEKLTWATRLWDREIDSKTVIRKVESEQLLEMKSDAIPTLLEFLGASHNNKHNKAIDKALLLHNGLLHDEHVKRLIKDKKYNYVNDMRAGKIELKDNKRMFILPDVIAFGQELLGLPVTGGLKSNEVSCALYDDGVEIDNLRSPHLFIEHAVRKNKVEPKHPYYITKGIYTSIHDYISTILMFDVDGDEMTTVVDKTFVNVAKRHTKGLLPLSYELKVGKPVEINPDNLFESLTAAFSANIGIISNQITKIFNNEAITVEDLKKVKLLVMKNNATIDYAKTLWMPTVEDKDAKRLLNGLDYIDSPVVKLKSNIVNRLVEQFWENDEVAKLQKVIGNSKAQKRRKVLLKLPKFFMYAKDKPKNKVRKANLSTVNRIGEQFSKNNLMNLSFCKGSFDYTLLLHNKEIELNEDIVNTYIELVETNKYKLKKQIRESDSYTQATIIGYIKHELLKKYEDEQKVVDVLVKYLYESGEEYKSILWDAFGDVILANLESNLIENKEAIQCDWCEDVVVKKSNRQTKCEKCAAKAKRIANAKRQQNKRNRNKKAS